MPTHKLDPTKWVDKYSDYLFNYAIVRVNDREVANDLISETFLAGLNSKDNFEGRATETGGSVTCFCAHYDGL